MWNNAWLESYQFGVYNMEPLLIFDANDPMRFSEQYDMCSYRCRFLQEMEFGENAEEVASCFEDWSDFISSDYEDVQRVVSSYHILFYQSVPSRRRWPRSSAGNYSCIYANSTMVFGQLKNIRSGSRLANDSVLRSTCFRPIRELRWKMKGSPGRKKTIRSSSSWRRFMISISVTPGYISG